MKKYKLIKKYPGVLVNVGDVVFGNGDNVKVYFPENGGNGINPKNVENFPEYWEEVKEETFRIETIRLVKINKKTYDAKRYLNCYFIYDKTTDLYACENNKTYQFSLEYALDSECFIITSVVRLSDMCVFKLNDVTQYGKITQISLSASKRNILVNCTKAINENDNITHHNVNLSELEKVKLFDVTVLNKETNEKFIYLGQDCIWRSDTDNVRMYDATIYLNDILKNRECVITRLRTYQDKVFEIGDSVKHENGVIFKIDKIEFDNELNSYYIEGFTERRSYCSFSNENIYKLEKIKIENPILFTAEDGVKIRRGDECYCVCVNKYVDGNLYDIEIEDELWSINRVKYENRKFDDTLLHQIYKYFSSKQKAEEYVKKNQVLFVTEDGVNILKGQKCWYFCQDTPDFGQKLVYRQCNGKAKKGKYFSTKQKAEEYIKKLWSFVTYDNVTIYEGDEVFFVENDNIFKSKIKIDKTGVYYDSRQTLQKLKCFYKEKEAKNYVENNKKKFSIYSIQESLTKSNMFTSNQIIRILQTLQNEK